MGFIGGFPQDSQAGESFNGMGFDHARDLLSGNLYDQVTFYALQLADGTRHAMLTVASVEDAVADAKTYVISQNMSDCSSA